MSGWKSLKHAEHVSSVSDIGHSFDRRTVHVPCKAFDSGVLAHLVDEVFQGTERDVHGTLRACVNDA